MRLDGLTLNELAKEIDLRCKGLRVERIHSAGPLAVVICMQRGNDIIVSASPGAARVALTDGRNARGAENAGFVMLLRKHLEGGRFLGADKRRLENAVELLFQGWDDEDSLRPKTLLLEATGRLSDAFLLQGDGRIIGCLKAAKGSRASSPGQLYEPLPPMDLPDAMSCTKEAFTASALRKGAEKRGIAPSLAISGGLYGLSAYHVSDLIRLSGCCEGGDIRSTAERVYETLRHRQEAFGDRVWPCREVQSPEGPRFSLILSGEVDGPGPSACVDKLLGSMEKAEHLSGKRSTLTGIIDAALAKALVKLDARTQELASYKEGAKYRIWADSILTSIHELPVELPAKVTLVHYADDGEQKVEVPLDARLSPAGNAERYYGLYNKAKRAGKALAGLMESSASERDYLESVKDACSRADEDLVLDQIREELAFAGYMPLTASNRTGRPKKAKAVQPAQFTLSSGHIALVGRNNIQNDELTFRIARPWDIWLHVKGAPGSHVVIRLEKGESVPVSAIEEAAELALNSSSLRAGGRAEVDYTEVRKVKKVKGGLPGAVTYSGQRSVNVTSRA